ncbi:MAG: hypothetical protein WBD31_25220 [Rubripirellula sp.]
MTTATVNIYQAGKLLHANRGSFIFDGFGEPSGTFGNTSCFASMTIIDARGNRRTIDGNTYGGGVTVSVRVGGVRHTYGIGSAAQVTAASLARVGV